MTTRQKVRALSRLLRLPPARIVAVAVDRYAQVMRISTVETAWKEGRKRRP